MTHRTVYSAEFKRDAVQLARRLEMRWLAMRRPAAPVAARQELGFIPAADGGLRGSGPLPELPRPQAAAGSSAAATGSSR